MERVNTNDLLILAIEARVITPRDIFGIGKYGEIKAYFSELKGWATLLKEFIESDEKNGTVRAVAYNDSLTKLKDMIEGILK